MYFCQCQNVNINVKLFVNLQEVTKNYCRDKLSESFRSRKCKTIKHGHTLGGQKARERKKVKNGKMTKTLPVRQGQRDAKKYNGK